MSGGPVAAPGFVLALGERVYRAELGRRNRAFDRGERVQALDRPVVSVGNLSVGGTGKTPMVAWLCRSLLEAGRTPCIAMRGYKGADGQSDEADEYRRMLEGVPVVAQPDRAAGLRALFETGEGAAVDCVVLDDGFQHRKLSRVFDLVLVDASRQPFDGGAHGRCLPAGWLREPVENLERASAVVVTHAERASADQLRTLAARIERAHGDAPVAVTSHGWGSLNVAETTGGERVEPVGWLDGTPSVGVCAIGNPEAFLAELRKRTGGRLLGEMALRDHDPFEPRTVDRLIEIAKGSRAGAIVCSEKDWSKLSAVDRGRWPCPVVRPVLELQDENGGLGLLAERVLRAIASPRA